MNKFFSLALFLLLTPMLGKANEIPSFSSQFDITMGGLPVGRSTYSLTHNKDGTYTTQALSRATGVFAALVSGKIIHRSIWKLDNYQVKPSSFLYQITSGEKYFKLDFNWDKKIVHIDDHKHPWNLKIKDGTQDVLSYQLMLAKGLKQGKRLFNFPIANGGKLKNYQIKRLFKETITTKLGRIEAIKLTRIQNEKRKTYVWVAPALNYIPVKAQHIQNGFTFTAELKKITGLDTSKAFTPIKVHNE